MLDSCLWFALWHVSHMSWVIFQSKPVIWVIVGHVQPLCNTRPFVLYPFPAVLKAAFRPCIRTDRPTLLHSPRCRLGWFELWPRFVWVDVFVFCFFCSSRSSGQQISPQNQSNQSIRFLAQWWDYIDPDVDPGHEGPWFLLSGFTLCDNACHRFIIESQIL